MRDKEEFYNMLSSIDGQEFVEYAQLLGDFDFSRYVLKANAIHREGIGLGKSALFLVRVPQIIAGFPKHLFSSPVRRTALEDLLTRKVASGLESTARFDETGVSHRWMSIACPGQKILPRSALVVTEEYIEARLYIDLPEAGGAICGDSAKQVFFEDLPAVINASLIYCNLNENEVNDFVSIMEDADQVRQVLATRGWVSFVAEGSLLSRAGYSDLPDYDQLASLSVSDEAAVEVEISNSDTVRGFGVPAGVTVILGDAFSGRVELMKGLAAGIYNHIPGDGREMVITVPDAVYVNAEPGRSIQRVDISSFVQDSSFDATQYTTDCADSVTAQAASTVESLEVGARVLLFDESDSAAGFLALDSRAVGLLPGVADRLAPLSARARQIADELGVSIVVAGSATVAEFIPIADTVLRVDGFRVYDITEAAKSAAIKTNTQVQDAGIATLVEKNRWVVPSSIDPSFGRFDASIDAPNVDKLIFGRSTIDLSGMHQLSDIYQTRTIGRILYYAKLRYMDEPRPIREILDLIDRDLSTEGLESLTRDLRGDLARPRRYEIAAALNRLGTLRITRAAD